MLAEIRIDWRSPSPLPDFGNTGGNDASLATPYLLPRAALTLSVFWQCWRIDFCPALDNAGGSITLELEKEGGRPHSL